MIPKPVTVRYNDWRQVELPAVEAFVPTLPVSVIMPCWRTPPETLARTLASLEGQTYPRRLFEVVIVDDGSAPPLQLPAPTPLDVRIVRQERRGVGIARARNAGARAAAHDVLLFLDGDTLVEAGWMAAHARWHHAVSDVLTIGFRAYVDVDGIDADAIRRRPGSLQALFSDRPTDGFDHRSHMMRTRDLTSRADDPFRVVIGGNFGIGKGFHDAAGGSDESFSRWGMEDVELGYRAYTRGGLLAPLRETLAWHQGRRHEGKGAKLASLRLQYAKAAQLIAHRGLRGDRPGRIYTVPQHVVTIDAAGAPVEPISRAVSSLLADRVHDLVVRIETPPGGDAGQLALLRETFGPDPRVRVAPDRSALEEFPVAPFHVTLPATAGFAPHLVSRLRAALGDAVTATAPLPDGSAASITRTWAIHRARRAAARPADFGEARTLSAASLKLRGAEASGNPPIGLPPRRERLLDGVRGIRSLADAWTLIRWLVWRCLRREMPAGGGRPPPAEGAGRPAGDR